MNKITLYGHLGTGVTLANGRASFRLADHRIVKGDKVTTWHNVVAFGKTAELLADNLCKRDPLLITDGRIEYNRVVREVGGEKVTMTYTSVVCNEFEFVGRAQQNEPAATAKPAPPPSPAPGYVDPTPAPPLPEPAIETEATAPAAAPPPVTPRSTPPAAAPAAVSADMHDAEMESPFGEAPPTYFNF